MFKTGLEALHAYEVLRRGYAAVCRRTGSGKPGSGRDKFSGIREVS